MLKFFKKIRQNLLTKNQISKYLVYAIGEIVLVVIGILIAIQINNWNQERNNKKTSSQILKEISNDLKQDTTKLRQEIEYYELMKEEIDSFLRIRDFSKYTENELISLIGISHGIAYLNEDAFNKLLNSNIILPGNQNKLSESLHRFYGNKKKMFHVLIDWEKAETQKFYAYFFQEQETYEIDEILTSPTGNSIRFQNEEDNKDALINIMKAPRFRNLVKSNQFRKEEMVTILKEVRENATTLIKEINESIN